ncbi:hypothetical protein [uncultured Gimesia sp.]|uniref:hypothetical protein n=1 Tax=uncultured Gimesia sp. TaxID=1678688 RepID=UPI002625EDA2|nr:hypothetical protein [uncultured Gimesia sp.]
MSTSNVTPSCVCNPHNSQPVEQLYQRSTNWPEMEAVEPPPIGKPLGDILSVDLPRQTVPIYLITIPASARWVPTGWKTPPPNAKNFKTEGTASEIAAMLNRERIDKSKDGYVQHWFIRILTPGSKTHTIVSVNIPRWKPKHEFDMPPAFIRVDGPIEQTRQIIGQLNERLYQGPYEDIQRAYIACPLRPSRACEQPEEQPLEWE